MNEESLLREQVAYYRSRAPEYDEWFLREGRYDRGEEHRKQWNRELDLVRAALSDHAPLGDTLEVACGTGQWTGLIAEISDSLTALDAVPETIELNRKKNPEAGIVYTAADVFGWEPKAQYDTVFFGFWLSHVPEGHCDRFWSIVANVLKPGGRVVFVDSLKTQSSTSIDHHALDNSGVVERHLNSGDTYRIVKRFYTPKGLLQTLSSRGWSGTVRSTGEYFLYGTVYRVAEGQQVG